MARAPLVCALLSVAVCTSAGWHPTEAWQACGSRERSVAWCRDAAQQQYLVRVTGAAADGPAHGSPELAVSPASVILPLGARVSVPGLVGAPQHNGQEIAR